MKLIKIVFEPKAEIEFSRADVKTLMELSSSHYDDVCQSLSKQGGKLYGMTNELSFCSDRHKRLMVVTRTLANRQIQLLCKLCEMAPYFMGDRPTDKRKRERGRKLGTELYRALQAISEDYEHKQVSGVEVGA